MARLATPPSSTHAAVLLGSEEFQFGERFNAQPRDAPALTACPEPAHQENDEADQKNEAEAAAAIHRTADVKAAAAEEQEENDDEEY